MKFIRLVIVLAALVFLAGAAISAEQPAGIIQLRFVAASEAYDAVKQQLGKNAASAVTLVDLRGNALAVDSAHADAVKVRNLVAKLDQRPTTVKVAASIKRIVPATPTSAAREEIIARPTVLGTSNQPMTLRFNGSEGAIEVEFLVTVNPETP